jgi:hypothetical protein
MGAEISKNTDFLLGSPINGATVPCYIDSSTISNSPSPRCVV